MYGIYVKQVNTHAINGMYCDSVVIRLHYQNLWSSDLLTTHSACIMYNMYPGNSGKSASTE